jgi:O-antigen/teichoic acid export membrane protein
VKNDRKQELHGGRYLVSVLGFSSVPRLITSVLTLVSFPIVLRAVGAEEYGVFVYATAMLSIVVLFADFGVAAAAAKAIAEARARGQAAARRQLLRCVRLQASVGSIGLIPVAAVSWAVASTSTTVVLEDSFLLTMILATWLAVAVAFARACLQAYLAFGWLAVLDTVESTVRTGCWLLAAWLEPSGMGLAIATLVTSVATALLGIALVFVKARVAPDAGDENDDPSIVRPYRGLIEDSVGFMGLGLATRVFTSAPYIVFGRLLGAEVVGVVGAFARLLEMVSLPFLVLGNALAVRAYEVKRAGLRAVVSLWNACFRFSVVAAGVTGLFLLGAELAARVLVPDSASAPVLFSILAIIVLTHSMSSFLPTMADFVGGLRRRTAFLSILAFAQIPLLWVAAEQWGDRGAVAAYALVNVVMICGYVAIAKKAFFGQEGYALPRYLVQAFAAIAVALGIAAVAKSKVGQAIPSSSAEMVTLLSVLSYVAVVCAAFVGMKGLRERFLTLSVFEFMSKP